MMKIEDTVLLHFEDETDEATRLARAAGLDAAVIERHRFPDDELRLRLPASLPARVVLYRSLHRPTKNCSNCCWSRVARGRWARST
jgi:hypothetical protein